MKHQIPPFEALLYSDQETKRDRMIRVINVETKIYKDTWTNKKKRQVFIVIK